jgi:hypothetical protein
MGRMGRTFYTTSKKKENPNVSKPRGINAFSLL